MYKKQSKQVGIADFGMPLGLKFPLGEEGGNNPVGGNRGAVRDAVRERKRERGKAAVAGAVYEQQLFMWEYRVHQIENRIVSLSQPWVRPIVRGKAKAKTALR